MHYLRGNAGVSRPRQHVMVDTESTRAKNPHSPGMVVNKLRLWCASTFTFYRGKPAARQKWRGKNSQDFWCLLYDLASRDCQTWVWAHNAGWDFTQLMGWQEMEEGRLQLQEPDIHWQKRLRKDKGAKRWQGYAILGRDCFVLSMRTWANKPVTIVSSTNFWPIPLHELGQLSEIEKAKVDFDDVTDGLLFEYCRRDVDILETAVLNLLRFVREGDLGKLRVSAAAQSMAAYRHRFQMSPVVIHTDKSTRDIERAAHYGGDCRAFFVGRIGHPWPMPNDDTDYLIEQTWQIPTGPVYQLDTNSLYPSVMRDNLFPCKILGVIDYDDMREWPSSLAPLQCLAFVNLRTPEHTFPVRRDNRTMQARGNFWTWLPGPELEAAVKSGFVRQTARVFIYDLAVLFTRFVDHFWEGRRRALAAGDQVHADLHKRLLVALYGKWGERAARWKDRPDLGCEVEWGPITEGIEGGKEGVEYRAIAWHVQERDPDGEPENAFPAISAWVTSYGRLRMAALRQLAGERTVYYQGVDSLHVNRLGYVRLDQAGMIQPDQLGFLRLVGTHEKACYWGPMDYQHGEDLHRAGWKIRGEPVGSERWKQEEFESAESVVGRKPDGTCRVWTRTLKHERPFLHGRVGEDGWLIPLTLPEGASHGEGQ
jgi:hypothetical protein